MRPDEWEEGEEIVVPPNCGWQSLDGQFNFQNRSNKTVSLVVFYEETSSEDDTPPSEN